MHSSSPVIQSQIVLFWALVERCICRACASLAFSPPRFPNTYPFFATALSVPAEVDTEA